MITEQENNNRSEHRMIMNARKSLEVHGVTDVISFDEQSVVLDTVCGSMTVEGSELHIHVLTIEEGIVSMDGRIDSIVYFDTEVKKDSKSGIFGKLFR